MRVPEGRLWLGLVAESARRDHGCGFSYVNGRTGFFNGYGRKHFGVRKHVLRQPVAQFVDGSTVIETKSIKLRNQPVFV